jgi:hypothetical protein
MANKASVLSIAAPIQEAERSFSCLKPLKTYLRNTIGQDRLSNLTFFNCEFTDESQINYDILVKKFLFKITRRQIFLCNFS